ncbi:hypothetical protein QUF80_11115 [Desulfococcaceae bacterium HSG8]|nr:hypothetical protein [Desulfococcaceae bacterium HSG8]
MKKNKSLSDLAAYHKKYLAPLARQSPYVLRIGDKAKYPPPVLIVKERREIAKDKDQSKQLQLPTERSLKKTLVEIGYLAGETQRRCLSILRNIVASVRSDADIPLELQRYLTKEGLQHRLTLPLDEEGGAKLGLICRLNSRIREMDRVELIARRVSKFTREEAVYWLSRTTSFGTDANRWALAGLRILLSGQPGDKGIEKMLESLR